MISLLRNVVNIIALLLFVIHTSNKQNISMAQLFLSILIKEHDTIYLHLLGSFTMPVSLYVKSWCQMMMNFIPNGTSLKLCLQIQEPNHAWATP